MAIKEVRRNGRLITIDTDTGLEVGPGTRLTRGIQKGFGKAREALSIFGDRLVYSDEFDTGKGRYLTVAEQKKKPKIKKAPTKEEETQLANEQKLKTIRQSRSRTKVGLPPKKDVTTMGNIPSGISPTQITKAVETLKLFNRDMASGDGISDFNLENRKAEARDALKIINQGDTLGEGTPLADEIYGNVEEGTPGVVGEALTNTYKSLSEDVSAQPTSAGTNKTSTRDIGPAITKYGTGRQAMRQANIDRFGETKVNAMVERNQAFQAAKGGGREAMKVFRNKYGKSLSEYLRKIKK